MIVGWFVGTLAGVALSVGIVLGFDVEDFGAATAVGLACGGTLSAAGMKFGNERGWR